MRFTAALRRFIAPSKHKMPGREACMRVGTPPLHFYRRLPDKLSNIPPISCSRERSCPAISNSLPLSPSALNAITGSLLSLLFFVLPLRSCFLISRILFATYICFRITEAQYFPISLSDNHGNFFSQKHFCESVTITAVTI